jgi:uncharacterized protein (DUF2147 family)
MIRSCALLLTLGCALLLPDAVRAADPSGTWITEDGEATIRIGRCGGALCGRLASLREPRHPVTGRPKTDENNRDPGLRERPLVGVQIVVRMTPNGKPGQWNGFVYNPEDGGSYPATLTVTSAGSLRLAGCMMKDVLCRGQTWTRAK